MAHTCQTWADHDLSAGRIVDTGRHAVLGYYHIIERRCRRCGKRTAETRWCDPPAHIPVATKDQGDETDVTRD